MMLYQADPNFIPGLDIMPGPALRHEVDRFGCRTSEYDLRGTCCVYKMCQRLSGGFIDFAGQFSQWIEASVNRPIGLAVNLADSIDDTGGFVGAGGGVEIMQRRLVIREYRKVGPQCLEIRRFRDS